MPIDHCRICGDYTSLTKHHALYPKKKWQHTENYDYYVTLVCVECHKLIHRMFIATPLPSDWP